MIKYYCLNAISEVGLEKFTDQYVKTEDIDEAEAILVRSAKMHDMEFSDNLLAIARAGAGVNNIPLEECAKRSIVVFNTPGANANAVKEMVLTGMLLSARDIIGGLEWVKSEKDDPDVAKIAEKQKKQFAGNEISGKTLGIIGLGAIGQLVANAAIGLGMKVYGYDPFLSVDAAWNLSRSVVHIQDVNQIYRDCDYITIHVPAMDSTKGMISREAISMMKDNAVVLNFARDVLVDEDAILEALNDGKLRKYVTDFANPKVAGHEHVLVTPHLGASTEEAEENCAAMAVSEIRNYIENGNIVKSVNYPTCDMGVCTCAGRIAINHMNVANLISQFTRIIGDAGINIINMTNKSKGEYSYSLLDLETRADETVAEKLRQIDGVLRVRIVK